MLINSSFWNSIGNMEIISTLTLGLYELAKEMAEALWPAIKTGFLFTLWVLSAVIILPCVFVAGTIYPMWEKWAEDF